MVCGERMATCASPFAIVSFGLDAPVFGGGVSGVVWHPKVNATATRTEAIRSFPITSKNCGDLRLIARMGKFLNPFSLSTIKSMRELSNIKPPMSTAGCVETRIRTPASWVPIRHCSHSVQPCRPGGPGPVPTRLREREVVFGQFIFGPLRSAASGVERIHRNTAEAA